MTRFTQVTRETAAHSMSEDAPRYSSPATGEVQDPPACDVCGSPVRHSWSGAVRTRGCIAYLRGEIARLESEVAMLQKQGAHTPNASHDHLCRFTARPKPGIPREA